MRKMLESVGIIDGYDFIEIGKSDAKKDEMFDEILKYDSKIKEDVRDIVNSYSGKVFAIVKKKVIKGIYLFKNDEKNGIRNLNHFKTVCSDEIDEKVKNKYNEFIINIFEDYVSTEEYNKVTLNDKVIQPNPKMTKKDKNIALLIGFVFGFIFGWSVFKEIYWGILYGIIFAPLFSEVDVVITNKRGRKRNKKK